VGSDGGFVFRRRRKGGGDALSLALDEVVASKVAQAQGARPEGAAGNRKRRFSAVLDAAGNGGEARPRPPGGDGVLVRPEEVVEVVVAGSGGPVDGEMSSMHRRVGLRAGARDRFVLMCEEACFYEIERAREANAAGTLGVAQVVEMQEVLEKVLARAEQLAADPSFIDEGRAEAAAAEAAKRPRAGLLPNPANELLRERVAVLRLCMESLGREEAEWVALQNKADADDEAEGGVQGGAPPPRERPAGAGAADPDPAAAPIAKALDIAAFHTDAVRSMVSNVQRLGERAMALCRRLAAEYESAVMGTINAPEDAKALIRKLNA